MRDDAESAEPADVGDDVDGVAGQAIRGLPQAERDVVAVRGADLDTVDDQHAGAIGRREHRPRAVAVIGEDDEPRPARAAAAAISSIVPLPSDRVEWTWTAPRSRAGAAIEKVAGIVVRGPGGAASAASATTASRSSAPDSPSPRHAPTISSRPRRQSGRAARRGAQPVIRSWAWWRKTCWISSCAPTI